MKAHELAKYLLAGPNLEVWAQNEESPDYPIQINGVEGTGTHFDSDWDDEDEDAGGPGKTEVLILDVSTDDGVLEFEGIIEFDDLD